MSRRQLIRVALLGSLGLAGLWLLTRKTSHAAQFSKQDILEGEMTLVKHYLAGVPVESARIPRQLANLAAGYALIGEPAKAQSRIESVLATHPVWSNTWGSPLTSYPLAIATWLLSDKIPSPVRESIDKVIIDEANFWAIHLPESGWEQDSKSEENAWNATIPAWAALLYPSHPNAITWERGARRLAYHTFTKGDYYDNVYTRTVDNRWLVANHGYYPHPTYAMVSWGLVGVAALPSIIQGANPQRFKDVDHPFWHNMEQVWQAHQHFIAFTRNKDPNDTRFINCPLAEEFNGTDDWGSDFASNNGAIAYLATVNPNYLRSVYVPLLEHQIRSPMPIAFPDWNPKARAMRESISLSLDELNGLLYSVQVVRHVNAYLHIKFGLRD